MNNKKLDRINQLELALQVYAYCYYILNDSYVSDEHNDKAVCEMVNLKNNYVTEFRNSNFYELFKDLDTDATTVHLAYSDWCENNDNFIINLLRYKYQKENCKW